MIFPISIIYKNENNKKKVCIVWESGIASALSSAKTILTNKSPQNKIIGFY